MGWRLMPMASVPNISVQPRPLAIDRQVNFAGGLNTTADDTQVAANEVRASNETQLSEFGGAIKRLGSQYLHATALGSGAPVLGGFAWRPATGQQLLAVSNGTLYTTTYGTFPRSWSAQVGALNNAAYPVFAPFRQGGTECIYFAANGTNKWDGTTLTVGVAGVPVGMTVLAVYNQRLFGITGVDENLYWSDLNNGDALGQPGSGGGVAIIRTFGEQMLQGLVALNASLLVFHVSGISIFTGISQDDISIASGSEGLTADVGTIAPKSIVAAENAAFFLTDRGFYMATEYGVQPISQKIDATVRTFDQSKYAQVSVVHNRSHREIWWYLPNLGIYVYNYYLRAWSGPFQGGYVAPVTQSMWEGVDTTFKPIVFVGDNAGMVKQAAMPLTFTDNVTSAGAAGSAITMRVTCRRFYQGDLPSTKSLRYIYVLANTGGSSQSAIYWNTGNFSQQTSLPPSTSSTWGIGTWGTGTWGGSGDFSYRVQAGGQGIYVDVTFVDSGAAFVQLSSVETQGYNLGRRY